MTKKSGLTAVKPTLLDKKFWQNFAKNIWEKKPLVLRNVKSALLEMGEAEIFDLLVLFSDRCRKLNNPEGFKFYIHGFKAEAEDVLQVLPEKSDKTLLGYHARMQALFKDYCLVCDELLTVNSKKQELLTEFTEELYRHVGFPNRFAEMGLYLGNYKKTPFGVHVDSCGVFSFPVSGVKKFRLWSGPYGKKNPGLDRTFKYAKYKKDSQLVEARAGDMVYWPSSEWHIAESDGSFSATWSLGVWVDQPHKEMVAQSLRNLIDTKLGPAGEEAMTSFRQLHDAAGEISELPNGYLKSIEVLQNLSQAELQESFLKAWMKHISLQGFKTLPLKSKPLKISKSAEIQLRHRKALILWQKSLTQKKNFYVSFGGHLLESASPKLLNTIKSLNAGKVCSLKGLYPQDLSLVQALANAGALA
ncbi:MAG: RNA methylase [Bdellovibrio sp.]|nr:RNA methylase [Bdellovibrio sp.]